MNEELEESPYCEVCGHCGEMGCCGIVSFLEEHVKFKTNCKNEGWIIQGIKDICEYEKSVFKESETMNKGIDELIKKYEDYIDNIHFYMSLINNMTEEYIKKYDKEISKVWQKHECYKKFINDLRFLKGE